VKKSLATFSSISLFLPILWLFAINLAQAQQTLTVDATKVLGPHSTTPLNTVGAGRANEGLRADWQAQLATVQKEIGFRYIRFHGLLHDDMGVYNEDSQGNPIYNFQYVDALYDELLAQHIRPFVEISFMPAKLASDARTVFWWKARVSPPKDMARWNDLIKALMTHWRARYGEPEINQWYFEVWNEPNLHNVFFSGNMEDYFSLYQNTADSIRYVCPHCRVGGPATASTAWINEFIDFTKTKDVPVDFISTHTYAASHGAFDADGHAGTVLDTKPTAVTGAVRKARTAISSSASPTLQLHITEWSSSFTPTDPIHDQYIEAAFILQKLSETAPFAESMSYWTFTDIFEELGPPRRPFHGGFGLINLQGIRKPAFYAYQFLARLGPQDVSTSDAAHSWATVRSDGSVQVLLWDYTPVAPPAGSNNQVFFKKEQPIVPLPDKQLAIEHLHDGSYRLEVFRTGYQQNDAYTAYLHMGSPADLTTAQVEALKQASSGAPSESRTVTVKGGRFNQKLPMHQNDTVLVTLTRQP
jgi:xylan 1,4-beta-xylosidase